MKIHGQSEPIRYNQRHSMRQIVSSSARQAVKVDCQSTMCASKKEYLRIRDTAVESAHPNGVTQYGCYQEL